MKVLIFEDNLLWSERLAKSVRSLGYEAAIIRSLEQDIPTSDVAIVNLGSERLPIEKLLPILKPMNTYVIGHAGHKETQLLEKGQQEGCDLVVTNGEITYKIGSILSPVQLREI